MEIESRLITDQRVSDAPNDKEQLVEDVKAIRADTIGVPAAVLVDSGFYSEQAVRAVEAGGKTTVYAAVEKHSHHRTVADLEKKPLPEPPPSDAPLIEVMRHRLKTPEGRKLYRQRQQTVEPVFGITKEPMGFRRFSLRGLAQVSIEWTLVCTASTA